MSRGGRGGFAGRGGRKGPDMSWDDEESVEVTPDPRKPRPLFPERAFPAPKSLTAPEKSSIASLISVRDRIRRGPLYTVLDPTISQSSQSTSKSTQADVKPSKPNPRAGFDPFNDQEKYTMKYHRKRRIIPDLSERGGYTLRLFPIELWSVLDPKRRMKEWNDLTEDQKARLSTGTTRGRKRKRDQELKFEDEEEAPRKRGSDSENSDDDDVVSPTRKRKQNADRRRKDAEGKTRQKKGLDAEDDYPDVDQQDEDAEGAAGEDEPHDSEFGTDEEDDDGADDYNAEQYFDDGADDMDGGGDGDEEGGGGGYY